MGNSAVKPKVTIRWCLQRDIARLVDIESRSSDSPWEAEDFEECLRCSRANGVVAEIGDGVAGYMMYLMHRDRFIIVTMAVDPDSRRSGCGSRLVDYLKRMVRAKRAEMRIEAMVSDRQLDAHLFLRSCGFAAEQVKRHHFGPEHDGYRFNWKDGER